MEFDKSRVYTALNADELQIGSKCIFANSIKEIKDCLQTRFFNIETLTKIKDEAYCARFIIHNHSLHQDMDYALAYLIELPTEPKYKPFSGIEKAFEAIKKHGWWVKEKISGDLKLISCIGKISDSMLSICVGSTYFTSTTLLKDFIFADDGSPCGELMEE